MGTRWRMLRGELLPSRRTLTLLWVVLGLLVIGAACSGIFSIAGEAEDPGETSAIVFSAVLPLAALPLVIAAFREKRLAPRAAIWFLVAILTAVSGLAASVAISFAPEVGIRGGSFFFLVFCAPVALLLFLPGIYFATKAWPHLRATLQAQRERRAVEVIDARGEVTFAQVAQELEIGHERVEDLLDVLLTSDRLKGMIDRRHEVVYSAEELAARQRRLLAVLRARGRIQVDELAGELRVPLNLLKDWIYQLVQRGQFTGYINWDEGMLYSAEAQKLREAGRCPHCNGQLSLAGKGIIHCQYCGAEVFL